jgi:excisionase family DNA binding protein
LPAKPFEPPPEKLAYTIKELATGLGIGKTTIYAALKDGTLTAVKLGNRTLIMAEVVREWVRSMPKR